MCLKYLRKYLNHVRTISNMSGRVSNKLGKVPYKSGKASNFLVSERIEKGLKKVRRVSNKSEIFSNMLVRS